MNAANPPIRNVIFDFGGVLVRWQPQELINRLYGDEASRALIRQAVFQHPDWQEMDRGTLSEDAAARRFAERTGRPLEEMVSLLRHVMESLLPIPESVDLLYSIARAGFPVYGLSNMPAMMFEYLRSRDEHWSTFRGIVISAEVKMIKPEPQIFEHIVQLHSLVPAETLFIDDLQPNIDAARRLGFQAVLFQGAGQTGPELRRLLNL